MFLLHVSFFWTYHKSNRHKINDMGQHSLLWALEQGNQIGSPLTQAERRSISILRHHNNLTLIEWAIQYVPNLPTALLVIVVVLLPCPVPLHQSCKWIANKTRPLWHSKRQSECFPPNPSGQLTQLP